MRATPRHGSVLDVNLHWCVYVAQRGSLRRHSASKERYRRTSTPHHNTHKRGREGVAALSDHPLAHAAPSRADPAASCRPLRPQGEKPHSFKGEPSSSSSAAPAHHVDGARTASASAPPAPPFQAGLARQAADMLGSACPRAQVDRLLSRTRQEHLPRGHLVNRGRCSR